jgi:hypothetical protein
VLNWQKISIERLREYETRQQALELIPEQIAALKLQSVSIRSAKTDGTPTRDGSGNKREDALINNIVMREELEKNYKIAKKEVNITEKGLSGLNAEQKKILYRFYINKSRGHVELLCEELCLERSRVYSLKDEALKKFTLACYGVVEI